MKMKCGVYFNSLGFKVGSKYAYVVKAYSGKIIGKTELTDDLKAELTAIKEKYDCRDVNRTASAVEIIGRKAGI